MSRLCRWAKSIKKYKKYLYSVEKRYNFFLVKAKEYEIFIFYAYNIKKYLIDLKKTDKA